MKNPEIEEAISHIVDSKIGIENAIDDVEKELPNLYIIVQLKDDLECAQSSAEFICEAQDDIEKGFAELKDNIDTLINLLAEKGIVDE